MNASLLLLSTTLLASADPVPIVVQGQGCTNCGSAAPIAAHASPSFASATFGAEACGTPTCGTPVCGSSGGRRFGLFDRLRTLIRGTGEGRGAVGCGMSDCGLNAARPAFGSALRSSFVASHTATAPSPCASPALPCPAPACNGYAGSTGIYYGSPAVGVPSMMPAPAYTPAPAPAVVPAPAAVPMPMPIPPASGSAVPKTLPPADAPKGTDGNKTKATPAPVVPLVPSELPRIPTLSGLGD